MDLLCPPLCNILLSFNADPNHYAITGSAALILRGLLPRELGDLDIIARTSAWAQLKEHGEVSRVPPYGSERILIKTLFGEIEVYDEWLGDRDHTKKLIEQAEMLTLESGLVLPLVPVQEVIRYKLVLGREKDLRDLELIRQNHPKLFPL